VLILDINEDERQLLEQLLHSAMGSLREEIYKTESAEYEALLKAREATLIRVQNKVEAAGPDNRP
jgi:hypothetical protein